MWADNYYRRRYTSNPSHANASLNCTALAVRLLPAGSLVHNTAELQVADLLVRCRLVVRWLQEEQGLFRGDVEWLRSATPLDNDIRVPLDCLRERLPDVHWEGFMLNPFQVSRNDHLVELLANLVAQVAPQCAAPMPLLVDEDLHYRLVRMARGVGFQRWNVGALLERMPPLFGIWHPYKNVCMGVWKAFLPYFVFLSHGTVPEGSSWPTKPTLRAVEVQLACVLKVGLVHRTAILAGAQTVRQRVRTVEAKLTALRLRLQNQQLEVRRDSRESGRRRTHAPPVGAVDLELRLQALQVEIATAEREYAAVLQMQDHVQVVERLLYDYTPACYIIGWMVRECHWGPSDAGSGLLAKRVLLRCLRVLMGLGGADYWRQKYFGPLVTALLHWTAWHSALPSSVYSEELCEAGLSRLASACRSHPQLLEVDDVMDLYILCTAQGRRHYAVRDRGLPPDTLVAVQTNVLNLFSLTAPRVMFVPWSSQDYLVKAETRWPTTKEFPLGLTGGVADEELLRLRCVWVLRNLLRAQPRAALVEVLDNFVELRDSRWEAKSVQVVERLVAEMDAQLRGDAELAAELAIQGRAARAETSGDRRRRARDYAHEAEVRDAQRGPIATELGSRPSLAETPQVKDEERFVGIPNDDED